MSNKNDLYQKALDFLANREHSSYELVHKLSKKFPDDFDIIQNVIAELKERNYLSDQRFSCYVINYRSNKGYGPIWINSYLKSKGIDDETISKAFDEVELNWDDIILSVHKKKFGQSNLANYVDKAKAMSFLQARGFSNDQIYNLYKLD